MAHGQHLADGPLKARYALLAVLGLALGTALGIAGLRGLRQPRPAAGSLRLVFWRASGPTSGLWISDPEGSDPHLLVPAAGEAHPIAVGQAGQIAFSVDRPDGGADLWLLPPGQNAPQKLVDCPGAQCVSPDWSPTGVLAYERRTLNTGESAVWLYTSQGPRPLASGEPEEQPRWAPRGERLATYRTDLHSVVLRDLNAGTTTTWPTEIGDLGDWSPDGQQVIFGEAVAAAVATPAAEATSVEDEDRFDVHLFVAGLTQPAPYDLSQPGNPGSVNDAGARWSPDGRWIAFGREVAGGGRQLDIADPSGQTVRPLTDEPGVNHAGFAWSPVPLPGKPGLTIAFVRKDLTAMSRPAEIWLVEVDGSGLRKVAEDAILPAWVKR